MKKAILAIAIAAAIPLTAQAAPNFYGRLNASIQWTDYATQWQVNSYKNWVGIRGEAPLYSEGTNFIYQVERGINLDEGTPASNFTSARNTYIGLAGESWGKFFVGTYDGVAKQAEGKVDQFNNTELEMDGYIAGNARYTDTINYVSPNFSGLTVNAQMIAGEGTGPYNQDNLADGFGVGVNFTQNTFWANLAYEKVKSTQLISTTPPTLAPDDLVTIRASAGVDVGNLHGGLLVQQRDFDAPGADSNMDIVLSGALDVNDRLTLKGQAAQSESALGFYSDDDALVLTVGADYALGKNVTSYFAVARADSDALADDRYTSVVGLNYVF